ncbi:RusA family crossover junction endodeoxyribonuclease [Mitsuokella jalaludinii]|uniref:RusA family crossover junction endodeoxyribonuclease n=1 Tax=Mitsuokella jalaludinii TaxID=187979 RepID=UPI0030808424
MAWRMAYDLVIPGEAVPQGRPRFGHGRTYDPPKSRKYKEYVRRLARKNMPSDALGRPLTCPVRLTCVIYRAVPKSWSRRKRADAIADKIRPTTRPDVSNVIKGIEDALNGVWYADDSQIVEYGVIGKWYAEEPRVYVRLDTEVNDGQG